VFKAIRDWTCGKICISVVSAVCRSNVLCTASWLCDWCHVSKYEKQQPGCVVSTGMHQIKASAFTKEHGTQAFNVSRGWLVRFCARHRLNCGEVFQHQYVRVWKIWCCSRNKQRALDSDLKMLFNIYTYTQHEYFSNSIQWHNFFFLIFLRNWSALLIQDSRVFEEIQYLENKMTMYWFWSEGWHAFPEFTLFLLP
jgi:hypothetical protein